MNNIAPWNDEQLTSHENIRASFRKALPAVLAGTDPQPLVWNSRGELNNWDRGPQRFVSNKPEGIVAAACRAAEISIGQFYCKARTRRFARTRQVVCYILKESNELLSYPEIADTVGYQNPTSVLQALRTVQKDLEHETSMGYLIYFKTKREMVR